MIARSELIGLASAAREASLRPGDEAARALAGACTPAVVLALCDLWRAAEAHYNFHPQHTSMAMRAALKKLEGARMIV
jgi:hypothetical protein